MSDQKYGPYPPLPQHEMQPPVATAPPQPNAGGWRPPNMMCPPGLESLIDLEHLFVSQKIELLQAFTGWETKNKYAVLNIRNELLFYMSEESDICCRFCLGKYRACEFNIYDQNQRLVLRLVRPFRFSSCFCPCYLQILEVYSGNTLLGSITQEWSIYDRHSTSHPWMKSTVWPMIQKKWSGLAQEFFTVSDNFGINFPRDLDVKMKAVLLGASLLIDFMYYEGRNNCSSV